MNKLLINVFSVFSFCILSCTPSIERDEEDKMIISDVSEVKEVIVPEGAINQQRIDSTEEVPTPEVKIQVPTRPLKEKDPIVKKDEKVHPLGTGIYTAEELTLWALNSQKNVMSSARPQIQIAHIDRYQLYLEPEQENGDIFWYLVSYVGNDRVDYLMVAAQSKAEKASLEWSENATVHVKRQVYNANNQKYVNVNERYMIDNDGKFNKVLR